MVNDKDRLARIFFDRFVKHGFITCHIRELGNYHKGISLEFYDIVRVIGDFKVFFYIFEYLPDGLFTGHSVMIGVNENFRCFFIVAVDFIDCFTIVPVGFDIVDLSDISGIDHHIRLLVFEKG